MCGFDFPHSSFTAKNHGKFAQRRDLADRAPRASHYPQTETIVTEPITHGSPGLAGRLHAVQASCSAMLKSPRGQWLSRWARRGLIVGILVFLARQLTLIGWEEVGRSLPTTPVFYAIFTVIYLQQPFFWALAYRLSWAFPFWQGAIALFKLCVYNNEVLGNSGEVYLFVWARKRLGLEPLDILRTIKDNAIVCWFWDATANLVLPLVFLLCGQLVIGRRFATMELAAIYGAPVALALVGALGLVFRRRIFSMPPAKIAALSGVYISRHVVLQGFTVLQWSLVMPGYPLHAWLTLLVLRNLINAIPLLPSNDLLFVGAGVELAEMLGIAPAPFAGMLLMTSALSKLLHFVMFAAASVWAPDADCKPENEADVPSPVALGVAAPAWSERQAVAP